MLQHIYRKLIPEHFKKDAATYSYVKNLVNIVLIALPVTPLYAWLYSELNYPMATYAILACGSVMFVSLYVMQKVKTIRILRNVIVVAMFLCLAWLTYDLGGITTPPAYWLVLPPLIIIILGDLVSGFIWAIIMIVTIMSFYLLELFHVPFPPSPHTNLLFLWAFSISGLVIVIVCLIYFFEKNKREDAKEIHNANQQLLHAKEYADKLFKIADEANRLKADFLANMSHELRTPLSSIIGFADVIVDGKAEPDKYIEYSRDILSSAHHLSHMIDDMLDVAEIDSGKKEFHPQIVNMSQLVDNVFSAFRVLIAEKNLQCTVEVDSSLNHIMIDPVMLKRVLYHFLSNAIKFTAAAGHIDIRVTRLDENQFRLAVTDTGIGIRQNDFNKLFVTFQQLDSGMSKRFPGTGVSLALTRRLVEAQGGQVGVESTFGQGSTFFAILPCKPISNRL